MVVGFSAASQSSSSMPSLMMRLSAVVGAPFSSSNFFGTRRSTRLLAGRSRAIFSVILTAFLGPLAGKEWRRAAREWQVPFA